ncbi:MAG TPA: MDR family MFS transporter [Ktedonobacteraceae bacterium]|nr:MDR family MFS transporter [Ktedonobacteraceae bacterium]
MQQEKMQLESSEEVFTLESRLPETAEPMPYGKRETIFTMVGVLCVVFLAMLDQTIVGTAMPHIVADLQGFELITWVSTAYLLTSTVPIPIIGKLSDLFGRKPIMLVGIVVFLTGSALSGSAQSMNQLIAFRAFQGLGAAALEPMAITIIGDLFPPRERGKWQGVSGSIYALAAILGPLAGGWITDNASWRWVFYVNIPIGILAMLVLVFLMPTLRRKTGRVSIDYIGAALLILGTVPLLLGFTLAGNQYAWLSPQIIGLFGGAVVILIVFVFYAARLERQGREPIFEPGLIKDSVRIYGVSLLVTVIYSVSLYGTAFAIPLFAQGVLGTSATNSGLILMPFMLTAIGGSVLSGLALTLTGKYKWVAILGVVIDVVGTLMLVRLDASSSYTQLLVAMLVLGIGVGSGLAVYTTVVQNVYPKKIGEVSSTLIFFRQLGGTIGLSAMGSVLVSSYVPAYHAKLPETLLHFLPASILNAFDNPLILLSPNTLSQIRSGFSGYGEQGNVAFNMLLQAVKMGLAQSIHNVFVLSLVVILFGLIAVFFLKEIPLRRRKTEGSKTAISAPSE